MYLPIVPLTDCYKFAIRLYMSNIDLERKVLWDVNRGDGGTGRKPSPEAILDDEKIVLAKQDTAEYLQLVLAMHLHRNQSLDIPELEEDTKKALEVYDNAKTDHDSKFSADAVIHHRSVSSDDFVQSGQHLQLLGSTHQGYESQHQQALRARDQFYWLLRRSIVESFIQTGGTPLSKKDKRLLNQITENLRAGEEDLPIPAEDALIAILESLISGVEPQLPASREPSIGITSPTPAIESPRETKISLRPEIKMPGADTDFTSWSQIIGKAHPPMTDRQALRERNAHVQNLRSALTEATKKIPGFKKYLDDETTDATFFEVIQNLHILTIEDLLPFKSQAKSARGDAGHAPVSRLLYLLHRDMLRRANRTDVTSSDFFSPETFQPLAIRIINAKISEGNIRELPSLEELIVEFLADPDARPKIVIQVRSPRQGITLFKDAHSPDENGVIKADANPPVDMSGFLDARISVPPAQKLQISLPKETIVRTYPEKFPLTDDEITYCVECAVKTLLSRAAEQQMSLRVHPDTTVTSSELTKMLTHIHQHQIEGVMDAYLKKILSLGKNAIAQYQLPEVIKAIIIDHYMEGKRFVHRREAVTVKRAMPNITEKARQKLLDTSFIEKIRNGLKGNQ